MAGKDAADRSGEERCAITLDCGAFSCSCAALGRRDMFCDGRQLVTVRARRQRPRAAVVSGCVRAGNQRAMHNQVSVAPDWRGEVGIAAQSQAEMTDIVRAIDGLRLAAKDQLVDESSRRRCRRPPQHPIEQLRLQRLSLGKGQPDDLGLGEEARNSSTFSGSGAS